MTNYKEGFENPPKIVKQMPDMMGPYDGLCLQTGNNQYWMKITRRNFFSAK